LDAFKTLVMAKGVAQPGVNADECLDESRNTAFI